MTTPFLGALIPLIPIGIRAVGFILLEGDTITAGEHRGESVWYRVNAGAVDKKIFPVVDLKMVSLFVGIVT
jgi:hypothetical protein